MKRALIVFQKNQILGKVKSRLAATIGNELALDCYSQMVKYTHDQIRHSIADVCIFFSESEENQNIENWDLNIQEGDDLGSRMFNAFKKIKNRQYDQLVIIGTDCLELTSLHIDQAFKSLKSNDYVIGPATDGGYYLLGLNQLNESIFSNKKWSTDSVFESTLKDIKNQHQTVFLLDRLNDIDDYYDLLDYQNRTGKIILKKPFDFLK